jgi:solute:Na+ symporter, SSS family
MFYLITFVLIYLLVIIYLSYLGYRRTVTVSDYLLAGRQMHPLVMAMGYVSTAISTSAIIGFGGASAVYGMSLVWLSFLNIFIGVWVAYVLFGKRTRKMGKALDAHTFPELLGRRYESRFIQGFSALVILFFMPMYAAAVLIGVSRFVEVYLKIPFATALLSFSLICACYVLWGGLKGVFYTSVFQAAIMTVAMIILGVSTYMLAGGPAEAHRSLSMLTPIVPDAYKAIGHRGFASMPALGSPIWWYVVTTMIMGVGIGALGQPQLSVRFMTVKSDQEIHRSIPFAAFFYLAITATAFIVGALTNVIFHNHFGKLALEAAGGNIDKIVPLYIDHFYPQWFVALFLVTLMAAAMSTNSAQFHSLGTALSRDFFEQYLMKGRSVAETTIVTRLGIVFGIFATLILGFVLPEGVVAVATALFFGLCGATFIPSYLFGLYWRKATGAAAKMSMVCGLAFSLVWMLFFHEPEAKAIGLCRALTGRDVLAGLPWKMIDPQVIALPLAFAVFIVVALVTQPISEETVRKAFRHI